MTISVLLADDNPVFLESVWRLLHVLPNTKIIAEARDGDEALAKAWVVKPFKPEQLLGAVQKLCLP